LELVEILDADAQLSQPEATCAPTETTQRLLFVTRKPELEEKR